MKTTSFAALTLAAALGLGACGSSTATDAGGRSTGSGSSSTSSAPGLKAGQAVDGGELATRMTNAMLKAGSATMTMDLGAQGKAQGGFVVKGETVEQQMTMTVQGMNMQIVSAGGVIYMKGIPGSKKPWVKIDPKATDPVSKMFASMSGDMGDPRQLAKALEGTKATVVSTSADGTVYDVTIDPGTLLGESATAAPTLDPVTARYTLDAQGRPTAMVVDVRGEKVTITMKDWGKPVTITVPPADQVGPFEIPTP